jgi:hypothetical protein
MTPASVHVGGGNQESITTPTAPRERLVIDAVLGGFGCRGWSPTRRIALCFVGGAALGADTDVKAQFVALAANATLPADIQLALDDAHDLTKARIRPDVLDKLRVEASGFVQWDEVTMVGDAARVGAIALATRSSQTDSGGDNTAPRYHWELVARFGNDAITVDASDGAISSYSVTAYRAEGAVVLARTYSIADEGQYEQHGDVFVCLDSACSSP